MQIDFTSALGLGDSPYKFLQVKSNVEKGVASGSLNHPMFAAPRQFNDEFSSCAQPPPSHRQGCHFPLDAVAPRRLYRRHPHAKQPHVNLSVFAKAHPCHII